MSAEPSADPLEEIRAERERARAAGDPNADVCFLLTVSRDGSPEGRAMTLRDVTPDGIGLLVSRTSRKWEQIQASGRAGVLIHWPLVHRQYRIAGRPGRPMGPEAVARWWSLKGHGSRLLEHFYEAFRPQSAVLESRRELDDGIAALRARFPVTDAVPIPAALAGFHLAVPSVECWHGSPEDRLHDRFLYGRDGAGWTSVRLVP